jgi:hypothetical protein
VNRDGTARLRAGFWASLATLLASSGTLVCCALPALLVALGAGAVLSSLVAAVPQLVWLSQNSGPLFALAGLMLAASGWLQWRNRNAPCPADPLLGQACQRTRRTALRVFWASLAFYAVGGWFAFALPWISAAA